MKNLFLVLLAYAFCGAVAYASDVTLTNTFSANQPARAGEVNQNFTDVKTAVDENNSRITTIEGVVPSKQDRVTGTCGTEESIKSINADGTVTCEVDNDSGGTITSISTGGGINVGGTASDPSISLASGTVTVVGGDFKVVQTDGCTSLFTSGGFAQINVTGPICRVGTGITLPDGATMTAFRCSFRGDVETRFSQFALYASAKPFTDNAVAFSSNLGTPSLGTVQTLEDTAVNLPTLEVVSNNSRRYFVIGTFDKLALAASTILFYDCELEYVY